MREKGAANVVYKSKNRGIWFSFTFFDLMHFF